MSDNWFVAMFALALWQVTTFGTWWLIGYVLFFATVFTMVYQHEKKTKWRNKS